MLVFMFSRPAIIMVPVWPGVPSSVPATPPLLMAGPAVFALGAKLMPMFAGFLAHLARISLCFALYRLTLARTRRFILVPIAPYQKNHNHRCHNSNDRQDRRMPMYMDEENDLVAVMRSQESQYAVPYNSSQSHRRDKFLQ